MATLELVDYFTVKYWAIATVNDGDDPDDKPDPVDVNGWVIFKPNLKAGKGIRYDAATPPFTLFPQERRVQVKAGKIEHNGLDYIKLEAPGQWSNPQDWNWKVRFDLATPTGKIVVNEFDIPAVAGSTVDLTTVSPVAESAGTTVIRGPQGYSIAGVELRNGDTFNFYANDPDSTLVSAVQIPALLLVPQAEAARDAAIAAKTDAQTAKTQAETARTGAQTARTGAEAARDTAVTANTDAQAAKTAAQTAKTQAETARDVANAKAGDANTSATSATSAATAANTSRNEALGFRNEAQGAVSTATTKAGEAATSATNAANSATAANNAKVAAEAARDQALQGNVNDGAVTAPKLATDAVITAKIQNGAVTLAKLAADSVDSSKIVNGSIVDADINSGAAIAFSKLAGIPFEIILVHSGATRKTGTGDLIVHEPLPRPATIDEVLYQFGTPDASGSTQVDLRKNGTAIGGTAKTITAADQVDGAATDAARTATATSGNVFAKNDRLGVNITALGTTPGKVLKAVIRGRYT